VLLHYPVEYTFLKITIIKINISRKLIFETIFY